MSSGPLAVPQPLVVVSSLDGLAPAFRESVEDALHACHREDLDAVVYESLRSDALQQLYFQRGTTKAPHADHSWHFFGLAVDVISHDLQWDAPDRWWQRVAEIFTQHTCTSGYYWTGFQDKPHHQWSLCRTSPSDHARQLYADGGVEAVWRACGAL